jgi:hypothetical protein
MQLNSVTAQIKNLHETLYEKLGNKFDCLRKRDKDHKHSTAHQPDNNTFTHEFRMRQWKHLMMKVNSHLSYTNYRALNTRTRIVMDPLTIEVYTLRPMPQQC